MRTICFGADRQRSKEDRIRFEHLPKGEKQAIHSACVAPLSDELIIGYAVYLYDGQMSINSIRRVQDELSSSCSTLFSSIKYVTKWICF